MTYRVQGAGPKVSICIPCYNCEPYLAQTLDSALAQTYSNTEVIVVDDGSSDASSEILENYAERGVCVIRQTNKGAAASRNRAFAASSGDLIKFLDADDLLHPEAVALQVERLGARHDAAAMGEWARFFDGRPSSARFDPLPMYRDASPKEWLTAEFAGARPMMQCGAWLFPRALLEKSGLWNEQLTLLDDFEFFSRVLTQASAIFYTPGAKLYYRSGISGNLSGQTGRRAVESAFMSLMFGTQHLLEVENNQRTRQACANVLQGFEYTYFPDHGDLRAAMAKRIAELGGANLLPDGPPGFHKLRPVLGWRLARRIQLLAHRLRNRQPRTQM